MTVPFGLRASAALSEARRAESKDQDDMSFDRLRMTSVEVRG
jgi:hypothetical protein